MKKVIKFLIVLLIVISFSFALASDFNLFTLPSGKTIKILGTGKMYFTDDDPGLMLKYQTDFDTTNIDLIRKEAEESWPIFRVNVEKADLRHAIISATEEPDKKLSIISISKSYNFVISKKQNGTWGFSNSWKRDYDREAKNLATKYFDYVMNNHLYDAAKLLKYPDHYTTEELKKDSQEVNKSLHILIEELGPIMEYKEKKDDSLFKYIFIQSGSVKYWEQHPYFMNLYYDVDYNKKGNGHVMFIYSIMKDELVIRSILYAIPANSSKSSEILEHVMSRFKNEIQ